jgi:hypothetical protein
MQQPSNFELRGQEGEQETEVNSFFSGVWNRQYGERLLCLCNCACWLYSLCLPAHLVFGLAVPLVLYGIQHYFSMIGSLILIPLIIVPAMDGNRVSLHSRYRVLCGGFHHVFNLLATLYSWRSLSSYEHYLTLSYYQQTVSSRIVPSSYPISIKFVDWKQVFCVMYSRERQPRSSQVCFLCRESQLCCIVFSDQGYHLYKEHHLSILPQHYRLFSLLLLST